jgi:hypothetical protein
MLVFMKRHIVTLSLIIVSAVIGFVIYTKTEPVDVWLVEYEYQAEDRSYIQDFAQIDTVFLHNDVLCRNATSSIADTLIEEGIRRHELKVQLDRYTKISIEDFTNNLLSSEYVKVINPRYRGTRKDKRVILYWVLLGFLGGIAIELITAVVKKPSTN